MNQCVLLFAVISRRSTSSYLVKPKVRRRLDELLKQEKCSRWPTMLAPAAVQLPLFLGGSLLFRFLAERPTPLDGESFLTLLSLARPDPTACLPIALGLITLANVESAQWFVRNEKWTEEEAAKQLREKTQLSEKGHVTVPVKEVVQGSLRVASVIRIVIGAMVDGVSISSSEVHSGY